MIYTRFGSEIKIIEGNLETGEVKIIRIGDGKAFDTHVSELKATDGIAEIINAIKTSGQNPDKIETHNQEA